MLQHPKGHRDVTTTLTRLAFEPTIVLSVGQKDLDTLDFNLVLGFIRGLY